MIIYIWVDDVRQPPAALPYNNIRWAKSYKQAIDIIKNGVRKETDTLILDLDHDLGGKKSGYDIAKWLVINGYFGSYYVHSMNPVGAKNIRAILNNYGWHEM